MGDQELLEAVVAAFVEDLPVQLAALRDAVAAADTGAAAQQAHKIKGAAGNLGAGPVSLAAAQLEQAGRSARTEQLAALLADLEHQSERLLQALRMG